jgi:hypothetical protein
MFDGLEIAWHAHDMGLREKRDPQQAVEPVRADLRALLDGPGVEWNEPCGGGELVSDYEVAIIPFWIGTRLMTVFTVPGD